MLNIICSFSFLLLVVICLLMVYKMQKDNCGRLYGVAEVILVHSVILVSKELGVLTIFFLDFLEEPGSSFLSN